jgi:Tfp pilus assembly protein PilF
MGLFGKPSSATPPPLPTSGSRAAEAQRVYEEGFRMFEAGQKREALDVFIKATKIDQNCVDASVAIARIFHEIAPNSIVL